MVTAKQRQIYRLLQQHRLHHHTPLTLDGLCQQLGLQSRGSLHKHIQALIDAGLVEPMRRNRPGIYLTDSASTLQLLPVLGKIAAGRPIEAIVDQQEMEVPPQLIEGSDCYILQVSGDSMIDAGIFDGDWVVIKPCSNAENGAIVVALTNSGTVTLKRLEKLHDKVILHPANSAMQPLVFGADQVTIQGRLVGQMRSYR